MGGESDAPQPGFDRWVSFRGQGTYLPSRNGLNVDGRPVPQKGYITDELTDYAVDWLNARTSSRPFFLYLSHKAVHSDFVPADRHKGRYRDKPFVAPRTMADTPENYEGKPMWVRNQRNSWHGVDFPYHSDLDITEYYRRYAETLLSVDESVGRMVGLLQDRKLRESTIIAVMGDNGFAFGEHGLIDKRTAYEESMRVPLLMAGGGLPAGGSVDQVVATSTSRRRFSKPRGWPLRRWTDAASFPWRAGSASRGVTRCSTSTTGSATFRRRRRCMPCAARATSTSATTAWDTDELYDLQADPLETRNLLRDPAHRETVSRLNAQLFDTLAATGGMYIPLSPDRGGSQNLRRRGGSKAADFPSPFFAR
jgi:N-acetylglucosamine-6-sulfatase